MSARASPIASRRMMRTDVEVSGMALPERSRQMVRRACTGVPCSFARTSLPSIRWRECASNGRAVTSRPRWPARATACARRSAVWACSSVLRPSSSSAMPSNCASRRSKKSGADAEDLGANAVIGLQFHVSEGDDESCEVRIRRGRRGRARRRRTGRVSCCKNARAESACSRLRRRPPRPAGGARSVRAAQQRLRRRRSVRAPDGRSAKVPARPKICSGGRSSAAPGSCSTRCSPRSAWRVRTSTSATP